jgi:hypothetical protein
MWARAGLRLVQVGGWQWIFRLCPAIRPASGERMYVRQARPQKNSTSRVLDLKPERSAPESRFSLQAQANTPWRMGAVKSFALLVIQMAQQYALKINAGGSLMYGMYRRIILG